MSILARIQANGGDVVRHKWWFTLKPGRLNSEQINWIKDHKTALYGEVWNEFDQFEERAAIMEYDGGLERSQAEMFAYREVT